VEHIAGMLRARKHCKVFPVEWSNHPTGAE